MNSEDIRAQLFEIERQRIRKAQDRSFREGSYCQRCAESAQRDSAESSTRASHDPKPTAITVAQNSEEFPLTGSFVN